MAPFEQGEIGPELFEAACRMGLEGLVSKHRERVYRPGHTGSRSRTGNILLSVASRTGSEIRRRLRQLISRKPATRNHQL